MKKDNLKFLSYLVSMASRGRGRRGRPQGSSRPPPGFDQQAFVKAMGAAFTTSDAPIFGGPVDNPSTYGISILDHLAPKSWYRTGTNYPWTPSYPTPLPYIPLPGPIHSYLNLKYEKKMNNYSL